MSGRLMRVFILSWVLMFEQVLASQVFFLNNRADSIRNYNETRNRMDALGLAVSNTRIPSGPQRNRLRQLQESIRSNARSLSRGVFSPNARDIEKINLVRRDFGEFQSLASAEHLEQVFSYADRHLGSDSLMVQEESGPTPYEQVPRYCQNYPIMDRDVLRSFYHGAEAGDDFQCYELEGNGVGLDLAEIGAALVGLEERGYQEQRRELQNSLILESVSGILEESSAYAGIYPGTDNNLESLSRCSRNQAVRRMGDQSLRDVVNSHRQGLQENSERLNASFGSEENARRNALMATQVRQALIIGNLYNISQRARTQPGGGQVAVMGGSPFQQFSPAIINSCRQQMEQQYGFSIPDNSFDVTYLPTRCEALVSEGRFENSRDCISAYARFSNDINHQTEQQACFYREAGRPDDAPINIVADNLIPLMSASVDSHPLLFNRDDSRSLIPFVSSESNYVPSDFARQVRGLPGARQISRAVELALANNPENPREAIENRLAEPDMLELLSGAIQAAQASEEMNNSLKNEVTDYQNELGESAAHICESDGEHLHQFPSLVNDAIARDLENVSDPRERERLLARRQAAQCWMLEDDPPENEGGLPGGFFALGVGAIALGMVPGIGWAASAALIAAGTGVAATDSYLRFDHARDQLNATTAAFQGGWADANIVLARAAERTDAQTMLWAEGLTVGILDVASPAGRAVFRSLRENEEIAGAITRFANDESGSVPVPFSGRGSSAADVIRAGDEELVVLTTRQVDGVDIPVSVGRNSLEHMREHDYPGGLRYVENLFGRLREEEISVDFLRSINSNNNGRAIFENVLQRAGVEGEQINLSQLLRLIEEQGSPVGQELNEGLNRILNNMDGYAFRRDRPTSLYPEEARLEDVIERMRRGEGEVIPHERRENAFYFEVGGRRFEGSFCANRAGCGCDDNGCSRAYGELNSLFPSCGPGIYMLSQSPNMVEALVSGALDDPTYLSERRYEAPGITGAAKGKFSDGLIRRVDCPRN